MGAADTCTACVPDMVAFIQREMEGLSLAGNSIIDNELFETLKEKALLSERKRTNYNFTTWMKFTNAF